MSRRHLTAKQHAFLQFLHGHVRGESLERCLRTGAICAAEIISHYGARPEANLVELMEAKLA